MRVLVIEDDRQVAATLKMRLERQGFNVETADLGEDGVEYVRQYPFEIALLDLNLPDISGLSVLRQIKHTRPNLVVLVLSGEDSPHTRMRCLQLGADDYVTKPYHAGELVARMRAIIRRANGHFSPQLRFGAITVDMEAREIRSAGVLVPLTVKEYQLVELLVLRRGATVTRETMMSHLYGGMDEPERKILDVYICKIRQKLERATPDLTTQIETVWGRGYAMKQIGDSEGMAESAEVDTSNLMVA